MASIIATNSGTTYEPVEAGNYPARCVSMIHIGTINEIIQGTAKELNKVRLTFELPTELKVFKEENGAQPYLLSKDFTLSLNEKANLRKFIDSWRGKGLTEDEAKAFDITKLIAAPCLLNIIHKPAKTGTNVYAEIASVARLPKGMVCPEQITPTTILSYDEWNQDIFDSLPDFIKEKIVKSREYKQMHSPNAVETNGNHFEEEDNDLPF